VTFFFLGLVGAEATSARPGVGQSLSQSWLLLVLSEGIKLPSQTSWSTTDPAPSLFFLFSYHIRDHDSLRFARSIGPHILQLLFS
jgi:hypothetical protein